MPLGTEAEQLRGRAGRDDERARRVFRLRRRTTIGRAAEIDGRDVALHDLGTELLGLGAHLGHEIRAEDPVPVAGKILDHGGQHQLPAASTPSIRSGWRFARAA